MEKTQTTTNLPCATDNLNIPKTMKEIESVILKLPINKYPGPVGVEELHQIFKEECTPCFHNGFQKIRWGGSTSKCTLRSPKTVPKTNQRNLQSNGTHDTDAKTLRET